ncbi:MAG: hypothetical protein EXS18_00660, partial [Verrucomicrobiae bacterium]|nr:hypothetical protein [Verrucomicrobiae bacterium]
MYGWPIRIDRGGQCLFACLQFRCEHCSESATQSMSSVKSWLVETGRALLPVVWLTVAWILLFEIFRVILIVATWYLHGDATLALLGEAMVRGLRFDLSVAVKLIAPFAAWRIWRPSPVRVERNIVWAVFAVVAFLSIFAMTSEVEFYKEFQMRLGPLVFEYFGKPEHNQIVASMIWSGYPVIRWMLVCFAFWALFVWIFGKIFLKSESTYGWQAGSMATVVWVVITVLAFRGGWQRDPLRWGNAFFSQSTYANHMTQNGVFALMDTIKGLTKKKKKANAPWTKGMTPEEAIRVTREMVMLSGETLVDPATYPLLRRSPPCKMEVKKRPKNVVLVIMESFSARFCGATGASFGATPRYDALAERGFLFDRAFSVGTHTAQGVMAALCAFPSLPGYDALMRETMASQPFRSLPAVLSDNGFQSLFIYNGLLSWDNKEGFFRNHGVQRFIGLSDFKNPTFLDPVWGVSDHDVF